MTDFGTIVSPGIRPAEHRNKAAEETKARLNGLAAESSGWKDRITLPGLEVHSVVARANRAAGGACAVHRADIASALGITPEGAERILGRLVEIGAVERIERLKQAPLLRAVTEPPASPPKVAQKAQRAPAADPVQTPAPIAEPRLKAGLVGMRNHGEPPKVDLRAGIVGANPRR